MKKTVFLLVVTICILSLIGCDFDAPLRNKMLPYYENDQSYGKLEGIILSVEYSKDLDELFLKIIADGTNPEFEERSRTEGYMRFVLVHWSEYAFPLEEGDTVVFTSAPMYFYNGHVWPIVQLEKEGIEYLSLFEGKANYLRWIEEHFGSPSR
jgi:hypothetical protein